MAHREIQALRINSALRCFTYLCFIEKIPLRIRSNQGVPCSSRSNQSMGLTRRPFTSIWIFSTRWGGLKGARPSVRQRRMTIGHDISEIHRSTPKVYHNCKSAKKFLLLPKYLVTVYAAVKELFRQRQHLLLIVSASCICQSLQIRMKFLVPLHKLIYPVAVPGNLDQS